MHIFLAEKLLEFIFDVDRVGPGDDDAVQLRPGDPFGEVVFVGK